MKLNRWFSAGWILWLVWFVVLETFALRRKQDGDTLSENVWAFQRWAGSVGRFGVAALLIWLLYHFGLEDWIGGALGWAQ